MPEQLSFINSRVDYVLVAIIVIMALFAIRNFLLLLASGGRTVSPWGPYIWGGLSLIVLYLVNR